MLLPHSRGPLSKSFIEALRGDGDVASFSCPPPADALTDDDLQLTLWICYELHYRGFDEVDDQWEWEPAAIAVRRRLEEHLLHQLRRDVVVPDDDRRIADRLRSLVDHDDLPSLSRFLQTEANSEQMLEFVRHRSLYQLKEADPHMWAVPRLEGRAKAALVEIQTDEYGDGDPARMHSELFRVLLRELGLNDRYGGYIDEVPGITLALSNVMSLFGLRRELRGALVGHLAAYEMTSSGPCRRIARGLRRLGANGLACEFYDVHVAADALHEQIAAHDMCGALAESDPALTEDIMFGAAACLHVDARFAAHVLEQWRAGRSSMRSAAGELATAS